MGQIDNKKSPFIAAAEHKLGIDDQLIGIYGFKGDKKYFSNIGFIIKEKQ